MHDRSIMDSLIRKVEALARENGALKVTLIRVELGTMAHMDERHFLEHWEESSRGTIADGAGVEVRASAQPFGVFLVDVELER